jgi:hypothetical protein
MLVRSRECADLKKIGRIGERENLREKRNK